MADIFSTFLHFRSLTANYNSPLFLPPKQHFSSALHSHNSRFSRTRRRPPHLLLLLKPSPFAASASEIVVISTHGTPITRFTLLISAFAVIAWLLMIFLLLVILVEFSLLRVHSSLELFV